MEAKHTSPDSHQPERAHRPPQGDATDFIGEHDQLGAQLADIRVGATITPARVIRLQRIYGNQFVQRTLAQRYEAFEHATEGDKAKGSRTTTINGVPLTSGELNAMADLYGSPDELAKSSPEELAKVAALIRRQQADPTSVKESEWDDATGGRYTKLNLKNSAHFGPSNAALVAPQSGSQDNRGKFQQYYSEAIVDAQNAFQHIGLPDPDRTQRLLDLSSIAEGFAEHFIMDAFSAGHLFNKDDFIAQLKTNLDKVPADQLKAMFGTVATKVLAMPASEALLAQYEPADRPELFSVGPVSVHLPFRPNFDKQVAFQGLLTQMYEDPTGRQAVYSALVKVVHDRLDTNKADDKGAIGVAVENDDAQWTLTGDKTLNQSSDKTTQTMIDKAIEQSRANIAPYRKGPNKDAGGFAPGAEKVMKYFPRPTAATATMINSLIAKVTDPAGGMIHALVEMLVGGLPSILAGLEKTGKIRKA